MSQVALNHGWPLEGERALWVRNRRRGAGGMDASWVVANGQGRSASWTSNDEPLSNERAGDSSSLGHTFLGCYWESNV